MFFRTVFMLMIGLFFSFCTHHRQSEKLKEGTILYKVSYGQTPAENPVISLMPETVSMKFKKGKTAMELSGWLNIFSATIINDFEEKSSTTMLKILNRKYFYKSHLSEPIIQFDVAPGMQINLKESDTMIAEIPCRLAYVTFSDTNNYKPFYVYYTVMTGIDSPNRFSPYKNINGMLMQFNVSFRNIPMTLKASAFVAGKIPDSAFSVPDDYEQVDRETLLAIIDSLI